MNTLKLARGERLRLLCLGAHADDIEIGCGATLLDLLAQGVRLEVDWCVLSASPVRAEEALRDASLRPMREAERMCSSVPQAATRSSMCTSSTKRSSWLVTVACSDCACGLASTISQFRTRSACSTRSYSCAGDIR